MQKHLPEPKVGINMTLMPEFKYPIILALATLVSSVLLIACDTEPSQTPTQAPTPTSSTIIPTPTDTATPAPTVTAPEDTPTPTNAPITTNTATHTPAPTDSPIPTPTITPLPTETPTPAPLPTDSPTPIPTNTSAPTETPTFTPTPTNTHTPVPAPTNTPIPTATPAPTPISADTPVPTPTYTPVPQPVNTPTPEPAATPISAPTETPIPTPTDTPSPTATATIAPSTTNDRDALVAIYNSLDGQYWNDNRNWLSDAPISEWKGVYTDQAGRVVILDLEFRGLNGEIPSELGTLGALQELLIAGNALHGTIPTELSQLSNLVVLDVSTNELTGQVPPELGNMSNLLAVQLSANQLSGCLPDAWRNIQDNDFEATGLPFCGDSPRVQPTPTTTPEPANPQEPTAAPTDTPTTILEPTATPTSEPTATPTPSSATIIANAFARFNQQRQQLGLGILKLSQPGDSDLIKVQEILVGCDESIDNHDELQLKNLDGIGIYISDAGSECGLKVITYHIIPESKKMKVEKSIWDCFAQSADINTPGDVSCGGRFEAYGRHVKWHPEEILYYTDSQTMRSGIQTLTSWIKEKTKVKVSEVSSPDNANLILYLGDRTTQECPGRAGCSYARQGFGNEASEIFISQQTVYFNQILKHELLHIILPMGHLPAGNTLMTVQPNDPSQTNNLTSKEEKLLKLYIDPYLRDGMTMDQYKQYLIIE